MTFGQNAGCGFVNSTCFSGINNSSTGIANNSNNQNTWCSAVTNTTCDLLNRAKATCNASSPIPTSIWVLNGTNTSCAAGSPNCTTVSNCFLSNTNTPCNTTATCTVNTNGVTVCTNSVQNCVCTSTVPSAFDYFGGSIAIDDLADNCPYSSPYTSGICGYSWNTDSANGFVFDEYYGPGSRCFTGNFAKHGYGNPLHSSCQKFSCSTDNTGAAIINISIGPIQNNGSLVYINGSLVYINVTCPSTGGTVPVTIPSTLNITNVSYSGNLTCPTNVASFCNVESNNCASNNWCSEIGVCYNNQCICPLGFETPNCSAPVCSNSTPCSNGVCNNGTCTCNPGWAGGLCSIPAVTYNCTSCPSNICYGAICPASVDAIDQGIQQGTVISS